MWPNCSIVWCHTGSPAGVAATKLHALLPLGAQAISPVVLSCAPR
jgi:hypothetical protein